MGKACGRNPDVYAAEKSDTGVVPKKEPNKIGWPMAEVPGAITLEGVERAWNVYQWLEPGITR